MATSDRYLPAAQAFVNAHPIGTKLTTRELVQFGREYKNGLSSDLLITDESKIAGSLRRHINLGATNQAIDEQYYLDLIDTKLGRIEVIPLSQYVNRVAKEAPYKATVAAMRPLEKSTKALDALNADDLDAAMQAEIETRRREIDAASQPLRQAAVTTLTEVFVLRLVAAGRPEEDARAIVAALPSLTRELKLLNQLRG